MSGTNMEKYTDAVGRCDDVIERREREARQEAPIGLKLYDELIGRYVEEIAALEAQGCRMPDGTIYQPRGWSKCSKLTNAG